MKQSRKFRKCLGIVLVMALILILPLVVVSCGTKPTPVVSATAIVSEPPTQVSTETPMETPTAAPNEIPAVANGQEPPPCTFPLAQITTATSAPENYTFSKPKVVLTAPKGNYYDIAQWLPDNQQVLTTEALRNIYDYSSSNNNIPLQTITLYDAETSTSKVYAIRAESGALPFWLPQLNAVVYSTTNYTSIDKIHNTYQYTIQARISYGDPNDTQLLADNLSSHFPLGVKPDGSEIVYLSDNQIIKLDESLKTIGSVSFDPTQWDYAKDRRNGNPVSFQMAWQPGTSLAFLYSEGAMWGGGYTFILNTDTGKVCELNLGGWAELAHWSSDGRYLALIRSTRYAFPTYSADLIVLDTVMGSLKVLNIVPQEITGQHFADDFVWAPDNRHLLAHGSIIRSTTPLDASNLYELYLVDFVSGQSVIINPTYQFYATQQQSMAWSPDSSKVVVLCPGIGIDRICLIPVHNAQ